MLKGHGRKRPEQESYKMIASIIDGIEVNGSNEFMQVTEKALQLLSSIPSFVKVKPYITVIQEAERSGMKANRPKPTYEVGRRTWQGPLIWYASTIVHDGYHSVLYQRRRVRLFGIGFTWPSSWTGKEAEKQCLQIQFEALCEMHAPEYWKQWITLIMENPTYQNLPYKLREW